MGRENQPLITDRGLVVTELTVAATSIGSGIAGYAADSFPLSALGVGLMGTAVGIEIGRQVIKKNRGQQNK